MQSYSGGEVGNLSICSQVPVLPCVLLGLGRGVACISVYCLLSQVSANEVCG